MLRSFFFGGYSHGIYIIFLICLNYCYSHKTHKLSLFLFILLSFCSYDWIISNDLSKTCSLILSSTRPSWLLKLSIEFLSVVILFFRFKILFESFSYFYMLVELLNHFFIVFLILLSWLSAFLFSFQNTFIYLQFWGVSYWMFIAFMLCWLFIIPITLCKCLNIWRSCNLFQCLCTDFHKQMPSAIEEECWIML